ncbi:hypothetical protein D3C83_36470 [compost metagenome]
MMTPAPKASTSRANLALAIVWLVASTPTTPDLVAATAGLMAGSMPTIGIDQSARSPSTLTPVAVLHATTTALAPCAERNPTIASARASIAAAALSPYGAWPESAT